MIKNLTIFYAILTAVFGFEKAQAKETYPFFLQRQDGTFLEGYFSPPSQADSPIIFAIQGSSCESVLQWYADLCDRISSLGVGVVAVEKQGISHEKTDLLAYRQTNSLQQRQADY